MPAQDSCHQQVVNALLKAGWSVDRQPYFVRTEGITIFADIEAHQTNGKIKQIIVVEVKCFDDKRNDQDELYRAIGQYLIYRHTLAIKKRMIPLYLAIPSTVYERIFTKKVVLDTIKEAKIKLILVDIDQEEIVEWLE
jgi:hypothetical protein